MDSGSSGSMQSSSGGDEEYDSSSRANQSSFLVGTTTTTTTTLSSPPSSNPNPNQPINTTTVTFFDDPSSSDIHYLNIINNNNPLNFIHSQSHFPNLGKVLPTGPSPSSSSSASGMLNQSRPFPPTSASLSVHHHHGAAAAAGGVHVVTKNPKKRTRASRRAPTTVLTTDTSNFRAMVQEFTGIPSPPFSTGSLFSSRRLDLFRSGSSNLEALYNPFRSPAQKIQPLTPSPLLPSSSSAPPSSLLNYHVSVDATNLATSMVNSNTLASNSRNYHQLLTMNMPNMHQNSQNHPVSSFQSLLAHQTIPALDDLGHHVNVNLSGVQQDRGAANDRNVDREHHHDHRLRPFDGNFAVSSSGFDRQDKGNLETNSNRNIASSTAEGTTVDSWIYPTDS